MAKLYPIGIQNFESLRDDNYFYIDSHLKTSKSSVQRMKNAGQHEMEFKFDGSAEEALKQIEEKGYAVPFANDSRQLIKAGVNFSSKTRNIDSWIVD